MHKGEKVKVTVFTPTYNRGYLLPRLYRSLQQQTVSDFEWIVMDDGSTDNTGELLQNWEQEENAFPVICRKVENGGKGRAVNKGATMASSEAFFIVDSDDYLLPDAIEKIVMWFSTIQDDEKFAGISGLRGFSAKKPIGGWPKFSSDYVDCSFFDRGNYGLLRDKAEVYKTELLKQYPFPEYENENYITPSIVWDAISGAGYLLRYFKEIIYICDYLEDGLTRAGYKKYIENPQGTMAYINLLEKIHGKEFADKKRFRFFFMLCTLYGSEKARQIMDLDADVARKLEAMYQDMIRQLKDYVKQEGIQKAAIYGLGSVGMAFLEVAKLVDVAVVYGFDQKKVPVDTITVYSEIGNYGQADAVIITMRVYDRGVEEELAKYFQKIVYWKDISKEYWFDE